jgi:ribosomal protein S18 acetylase RimI-like enzyme
MTPTPAHDPIVVRRELRSEDELAIGDLHERIYPAEFGMNANFCESVRQNIAAARARGWPAAREAVWLIDGERELAGSLGLTSDGDVGHVRWFVLAPELRGRGFGRSLVNELIAEARAAGYTRLELETFSDLATAARIYRAAGFRLLSSRERHDWGPPVVYQSYALEL